MIFTLPLTGYVAKGLVYLLGTNENGHITLVGNEPIRLAIKRLLTGKDQPMRPSRASQVNPDVLELHVEVPADHFARGKFILDTDRISQIETLTTAHLMQELYTNKLQGATKGYTAKRVIYDFMERLESVDCNGLNYQMLKRKLNRYEAKMKHNRRNSRPSRIGLGTNFDVAQSAPGAQA